MEDGMHLTHWFYGIWRVLSRLGAVSNPLEYQKWSKPEVEFSMICNFRMALGTSLVCSLPRK